MRTLKNAQFALIFVGNGSGPSPAGGPVVPGPPFEIGVLPFHVWPPGWCIHPIQYFKNVPPFLVFGPSYWFLAPLLLNPATGPS